MQARYGTTAEVLSYRMRNWIKAAMGLAMLATVSAASAQISLSSAVDLTLRSNPKVRAAQASVQKARAAVAQTHDAYIPVAGITGGYGTSTGVPLSIPVVFGIASNSLVFNFSQRDNVRAAESGLNAAMLSLSETRDQVAEDVVVTYLQLNNAEQRQAVTGEELSFANRLVAIVQDRLGEGLEDNMDVLRARKAAKQIELQKLQLDDLVLNLADHLSRLVGLPGNQLRTVPESIPDLPAVNILAQDAQTATNESFGIESAFADAHSKQETAFGEARYRLRPQVTLGANYSRISTSQTDFTSYYPGFIGKSRNAASIGFQIQVPLFDRAHEDRAKDAAAEAARTYFNALDSRTQFLEGRRKLQHSAAELSTRSELAAIDRDIAQAELQSILTQLQGPAATGDSKPALTPKDEQNARMQERARTLDLLEAQLQLSQAQVNLMRQTGQLDSWLHTLATAPERSTSTRAVP